jgi:glycosyltransferase involved in cell wall biosynthesis
MTRVLLVSPLPPPEGGISAWTQTLMRHGLPDGFDLELVDTRVARKHWREPTRLTPGELRRLTRIWRQVRGHLKSGRIDVMHLNNSPTSTLGVFRDYVVARIAVHYGVPFAVQMRGRFSVPAGGGLIARARRRAFAGIFERAAVVLTLNSESSRAVVELAPLLGDKVEQVPNFIVCDEMPKREQPLPDGAKMQVVFAGTLTPNKGIRTMLEVLKRTEGIHLTLIGPTAGESKAEVEAVLNSPELADRITATGSLTVSESRRAIASGDVYLFPSEHEGFPISVLEAMTAGLAVVASPVGAIPDMIDVPAGGELIPYGDVAPYVVALERLRDNPDLRIKMGAHNRARALTDYDFSIAVRKLCDVYARIVSSASQLTTSH